MFRFRRAWLFYPLLVLTLFFAACGWRNWNLTVDRSGVLARSVFYATDRLDKPIVWAPGFSERDARQIERRNPKLRLVPIKTTEMPTDGGTRGMPWVYVEHIVLHNRFYATIEISFGDPAKDDLNTMRRDSHKVTSILTRSPLTFWDNSWHITRDDEHK